MEIHLKSSTILKQGLLVFVALVSISILIPTPYVNAQVCDEEFYSNYFTIYNI